MICFLGSIFSIAMLQLSIELSSSPLTEPPTRCTKLLSKVYIEQHLEVLVYVCDEAHIYYDTHSPLTIGTSTGTRYFAAVAVLTTYVVHDMNSLDTHISCTVHEQDWWWRGTRGQTTCVLYRT